MSVDDNVHVMAKAVANYMKENTDKAVLILCEAGKTRSVFFSILVTMYYRGCKIIEAYKQVVAAVPGHRLKDSMLQYILRDHKGPRIIVEK